MSAADFWQVTYNGVTKNCAAWGISGMKRKRKSAQTNTVTFKLDGGLFDTHPLPFACELLPGVLPKNVPLFNITRNGQPWFSGIVTQPEASATAKRESINYEISDPWYWLQKTEFQQQWVTTDLQGGALVTMTTTRSNTILGQSLDGTKMNSGQVMLEVLLYAQYAWQMTPFPTTVNVGHLPPAPNPAPGLPFLIGTLTPSITVPYIQLRDKSCADIIRYLMKFTPSAVAWFDYTTSPPTLNIDKRSNLQQKTINVVTKGNVCAGFDPKPRYDLQVPCVVCKFEQKNSFNGTSYDNMIVQVYPPAPPGIDPGAWASQPRAWVQTVDLIGSNTTQQSVDIKVIERPNNIADSSFMTWVFYKDHWLKGTSGGVGATQFLYDWGNIHPAYIDTNIDPNDPLNTKNPNNVTLPNLPQLTEELLTGTWADWLQESQELDVAKAVVEVWLTYSGSDAATQALFWFDPTNPGTPKTDGTGYMIRFYNCKLTNASTQTYSELTSWSAAEPVPQGMAQSLWQDLAEVLHFEGTYKTREQECSDPLPIGCTFNTTDGNPDWQTMQALVLSVEEDIDHGDSVVQFGPPLILGLGEMEELFRANLGRLPTFKLEQRQTGKVTAGANVEAAKHAADTNTMSQSPVAGGIIATYPYKVSGASDTASGKVTVKFGTHNNFPPTIDGTNLVPPIGTPVPQLTLGNSAQIIYFQFDFTYDGSGNVTVTDGSINSSNSSTPPASTLSPAGGGGSGGSGTFYQTLAAVTVIVPVMMGKPYGVTIEPNLMQSQVFGVCGGAIWVGSLN